MPNHNSGDAYCDLTTLTTAGMTVAASALGYFSGAVLPALTKVGRAHPIAQGRTASVGMGLLALIFTPAYMCLVRNENPKSSVRGVLQFFGTLAVMLLAYPTAQGIIPNEAEKTNYNDTTANIALGILFAIVAKAILGSCCSTTNQETRRHLPIRYVDGDGNSYSARSQNNNAANNAASLNPTVKKLEQAEPHSNSIELSSIAVNLPMFSQRTSSPTLDAVNAAVVVEGRRSEESGENEESVTRYSQLV